MTREPIYAAVLQFFAGLTRGDAPLFATVTRKLRTWDDIDIDTPALMLRQQRELGRRQTGFPTIWTLSVQLWIYARTSAQNDETVVSSTVLNPLLDAVEAALVVDDITAGKCTLGGLVSHCAIQGAIEIIEGTAGDEAVAIVPLEIIVSP